MKKDFINLLEECFKNYDRRGKIEELFDLLDIEHNSFLVSILDFLFSNVYSVLRA